MHDRPIIYDFSDMLWTILVALKRGSRTSCPRYLVYSYQATVCGNRHWSSSLIMHINTVVHKTYMNSCPPPQVNTPTCTQSVSDHKHRVTLHHMTSSSILLSYTCSIWPSSSLLYCILMYAAHTLDLTVKHNLTHTGMYVCMGITYVSRSNRHKNYRYPNLPYMTTFQRTCTTCC